MPTRRGLLAFQGGTMFRAYALYLATARARPIEHRCCSDDPGGRRQDATSSPSRPVRWVLKTLRGIPVSARAFRRSLQLPVGRPVGVKVMDTAGVATEGSTQRLNERYRQTIDQLSVELDRSRQIERMLLDVLGKDLAD